MFVSSKTWNMPLSKTLRYIAKAKASTQKNITVKAAISFVKIPGNNRRIAIITKISNNKYTARKTKDFMVSTEMSRNPIIM